MRILHTADWHLGKLFEGYHLTDDQAYALEDFVRLVRDSRPDVVIIAGDLYDRSIPPHEAVTLFNDVLTEMVMDVKMPVVAIAGNHDSPERIDFGADLLRGAGLVLAGAPLSKTILTLDDADGPVDFVPIPFATPEALRSALRQEDKPIDGVQGFEAAMKRQVDEILLHSSNRRRVGIAHAFVTGGHTSESERDLQVGGTGDVAAQIFDPFDYTALGHLHRPQWIDAKRRGRAVRYSGSLLPYSFSEIDQPKSVSLVEMGPDGVVSIEYPSLRTRRGMRKITGAFEEILQGADNDPHRDDYLWIELTDPGLILQAMPRLRELYPHAVKLTRALTLSPTQEMNRRDIRETSPLDIVRDFWRDIGHEDQLSPEQEQALHRAIEVATKGSAP